MRGGPDLAREPNRSIISLTSLRQRIRKAGWPGRQGPSRNQITRASVRHRAGPVAAPLRDLLDATSHSDQILEARIRRHQQERATRIAEVGAETDKKPRMTVKHRSALRPMLVSIAVPHAEPAAARRAAVVAIPGAVPAADPLEALLRGSEPVGARRGWGRVAREPAVSGRAVGCAV